MLGHESKVPVFVELVQGMGMAVASLALRRFPVSSDGVCDENRTCLVHAARPEPNPLRLHKCSSSKQGSSNRQPYSLAETDDSYDTVCNAIICTTRQAFIIHFRHRMH